MSRTVGNISQMEGDESRTEGDMSHMEGMAVCESTVRQVNRGEVGRCGEGGERERQGGGRQCRPPTVARAAAAKGVGHQGEG